MQSIGKHKYSTVYQFICSVRDRYITRNHTTQPTFLNSEPALACCGAESCQMSLESIKRCIKTRWDALACYYYDYYTHWDFLKPCGTYSPNGTERAKLKQDLIQHACYKASETSPGETSLGETSRD